MSLRETLSLMQATLSPPQSSTHHSSSTHQPSSTYLTSLAQCLACLGTGCWPAGVGILAIEAYFPKRKILQSDLEQHDNVSNGKYTKGLMQKSISFTGDREDIVSICLTVTEALLQRTSISPKNIGYLQVGTETVIDKSKSVKSCLMRLFAKHGNTSLEGIDNTNACYGGTAALFAACQYIDSGHWDGRLGMVVAGDIAVYSKGPARPTSGCGAIAMLIGPSSPLVIERGLRATHMEDAYDFYKPDMTSEYPIVDGALSQECYLKALDICYSGLVAKWYLRYGTLFTPDSVDYVCFHSPYVKLVRKAYGRLYLNAVLTSPDTYPSLTTHPLIATLLQAKSSGYAIPHIHTPHSINIDDDGSTSESDEEVSPLQSSTNLTHAYIKQAISETFVDKSLDTLLAQVSEPSYLTKTLPSTTLCAEIGNTYTAALYFSLISLLSHLTDYDTSSSKQTSIPPPAPPVFPASIDGQKRILMFSYGSGLAASMFIITIDSLKLASMSPLLTSGGHATDGVQSRLSQRIVCTPTEFETALHRRERLHLVKIDSSVGGGGSVSDDRYTPMDSLCELWTNSYYLESIDSQLRRRYARVGDG